MGLRTLADKGCGLTDALGEYMKMQLLKDQIAVTREELAANNDLRLAHANYYNAQAEYLGRSEGKNTGRGGGGAGTVGVQYLQNSDGTWVSVPTKVEKGSTPQPMPVTGIGPGATRPGTTQAAPVPGTPSSGFDRVLDTIFGRGDAGTTAVPPSPSIRRFDKEGNPI